MEQAMYYELIIRRANGNGGRYCVAGADADIFRAMERDWSLNMESKYGSTEFERGLSLGIVVAFLRDSIERLIKSGEYSENDVKKLQSAYDELLQPTLKIVDNVIESVRSVLKPL